MGHHRTFDAIPGTSLPIDLTVLDPAGVAIDLTGATVTVAVTCGTYTGTPGVSTKSATTKTILVTEAIMTAIAGRQGRLRTLVTPLNSTETTGIDAHLNVAPA